MRLSLVASLFALGLLAAGCAASADEASSASVQDLEAKPIVQTVKTSAGKVLANAAGLSLYTFDRDVTSESTCYNGCAVTWPPVLVPEGAKVAAPFGTTTRTDGATQLTVDGHPLYTYAGDAAQGDVNGDGLGGVWHLARPAAPPSPVQTVKTTAGLVFANADGLSLYTFDRDVTSESTCYETCAVHWPPMLVDASAKIAAPFGTTTRTDGTTQLTVDGHPLYLYFGDAAPGDITGDGLGDVWHLARPAAKK